LTVGVGGALFKIPPFADVEAPLGKLTIDNGQLTILDAAYGRADSLDFGTAIFVWVSMIVFRGRWQWQ